MAEFFLKSLLSKEQKAAQMRRFYRSIKDFIR